MQEALEDPKIFGAVLPGEKWQAWCVVLITEWGELLSPEGVESYRLLCDRNGEPSTLPSLALRPWDTTQKSVMIR
ncbi:hypothetical protein MKK50_17940 [Methylobacterium sp. J-043]|nr:hypothetical protein [Methylobacterium sp. J-043]